MNTIIISYSLNGNNGKLAQNLSQTLKARHIVISEPSRRTMLTIVLDVLFKRIPKVNPPPTEILPQLAHDDLVLFVAPVWLGQVATPLRSYLSKLQVKLHRYAFISISGGAKGPNPNLERELTTRVGKKPITVINLFTAQFLSQTPPPEIKDTIDYKITENEATLLSKQVVERLQKFITR